MIRRMDDDPLAKYKNLFDKHMANVDKLGQIVLNGHLILENALDNIVETIFLYPHYLQDCRFTFAQKLRMARAHSWRKHDLPSWTIISSINAVRNEIAHNLAGEKRTEKVEQLCRLWTANATKDQLKLTDGSAEFIVYAACAESVGFLSALESDARSLRGFLSDFSIAIQDDDR